MANTGFHACGTAANVAGTGSDWSSPTNAQARDVTNLATSAIPAFGATDYLRCTNFGLSADVPDGATIDGIIVRINRKASLADILLDSDLKLWNGSTVIGDNKASATLYPTSLTDKDYGTASDKWGATLTATLIRSSTFGVQLLVINLDEASTRTASVDVVEMCVYYTEAPTFIPWAIIM